ncbi:hypothetical protein ACVIW0_005063 [Bradyrhizobium sp. USDA 4454]
MNGRLKVAQKLAASFACITVPPRAEFARDWA